MSIPVLVKENIELKDMTWICRQFRQVCIRL